LQFNRDNKIITYYNNFREQSSELPSGLWMLKLTLQRCNVSKISNGHLYIKTLPARNMLINGGTNLGISHRVVVSFGRSIK
jgi:hypothetical protein